MSPDIFKKINAWFYQFADGYKTNGKLEPMLQLKVEHSERVAAECRGIAAELGWSSEEITACETAGLLHDVGRFPQFTEYRTFRDAASVNHAERGWEVLNQCPALQMVSNTLGSCIRDAVRYHNRRELPPEIHEESLRFVRLLRDADKIDIFKVVYDAVIHNRVEEFGDIFLGADPNGPVSDDLLQELMASGHGCYRKLRSLKDMHLVQIAWVYDLNFTPSLKRMADRQMLEKLEKRLPDRPDIVAYIQKAKQYLCDRLSGCA